MSLNNVILKIEGITKNYPGVLALKNINIEIFKGEVRAIVGENGAGKSTLMKILSGSLQKDSGEIFLEGHKVDIRTPRHASDLGISIINQEFNLIPEFNFSENMFLGREYSKFGFLRKKLLIKKAEEVLNTLGINLDPKTPVSKFSLAQQQIIEIAKAISFKAKIIIMDEPTSALTSHEVENLFKVIKHLQVQGTTIIYLSHRIEEVLNIADNVTVMRDGEIIDTKPIDQLDRNKIIDTMVGRKLSEEYPKEEVGINSEALRTEGLSRGFIKNVSITIREGEIVALTGLT